MKPNVKLNNIIALTLDLADQGKLTTVNIGGNSKTVQVFLETESKVAGLDDKDAMNAISDWLSLASGDGVEEDTGAAKYKKALTKLEAYVRDKAEAKSEAAKAVKQQVDKPRFTNRGLVDVTAPSVLSS